MHFMGLQREGGKHDVTHLIFHISAVHMHTTHSKRNTGLTGK